MHGIYGVQWAFGILHGTFNCSVGNGLDRSASCRLMSTKNTALTFWNGQDRSLQIGRSFRFSQKGHPSSAGTICCIGFFIYFAVFRQGNIIQIFLLTYSRWYASIYIVTVSFTCCARFRMFYLLLYMGKVVVRHG